jgi:hypothetical protein
MNVLPAPARLAHIGVACHGDLAKGMDMFCISAVNLVLLQRSSVSAAANKRNASTPVSR